jgi:hypothetical protein
MVVVMPVRPSQARDGAGCVAGVGFVVWSAWKRMPEEKHGTPGGCQALRRNKANDFSWMQLKPMEPRDVFRYVWSIRACIRHVARRTCMRPGRSALHAGFACGLRALAVRSRGRRARSTRHPFVRESPPMAP